MDPAPAPPGSAGPPGDAEAGFSPDPRLASNPPTGPATPSHGPAAITASIGAGFDTVPVGDLPLPGEPATPFDARELPHSASQAFRSNPAGGWSVPGGDDAALPAAETFVTSPAGFDITEPPDLPPGMARPSAAPTPPVPPPGGGMPRTARRDIRHVQLRSRRLLAGALIAAAAVGLGAFLVLGGDGGPPDASVTLAAGTTRLPDGTYRWANGTLVAPDRTVTWPDGSRGKASRLLGGGAFVLDGVTYRPTDKKGRSGKAKSSDAKSPNSKSDSKSKSDPTTTPTTTPSGQGDWTPLPADGGDDSRWTPIPVDPGTNDSRWDPIPVDPGTNDSRWDPVPVTGGDSSRWDPIP